MDGKPTMLFVLGPPRSGTSAIAGVFSRFGWNFGDESRFVDPAIFRHNPKFYELVWVNSLNDEIFRALGSTWTSLELFSADQFNGDPLRTFRPRIAEGVRSEWGSELQTIAIKDPRISLLFPVWRSVLNELGYEVRCAISLRHPRSYMRSEGVLSGWPSQRLILDWLRHMVSAISLTECCERCIVDYDQLVAHPVTTIERIAAWLGTDNLEGVASAVDPQLCHHVPVGAETPSRCATLLYQWMRPEGGCGDCPSLPDGFFEIVAELSQLLKAAFDHERESAIVSVQQNHLAVIEKAREQWIAQTQFAAQRLRSIEENLSSAPQRDDPAPA